MVWFDNGRFLVGVLVWMILARDAISFAPVSTSPRAVSLVKQKLKLGEDIGLDPMEIEKFRARNLREQRKKIRSTLRAAEGLRNFRIANGFVPELDENGKPLSSDSKTAVTFTAFAVAAGVVALRIGGRAALLSAIGLDFANDNPELKENMDRFLEYLTGVDEKLRLLVFLGAWMGVKVFCFDLGGIVLALSAGIVFGGVFQGALLSALGATIGSSVGFGLAKLDTPVRKKALDIVEEYPSLRGIEKVVARDGFKAILTLRLAPILPIPLGVYNYVYGVTNVPFLDFVGGTFVGSLKPYLLDSYLGYFGKTVIDGTAGSGLTMQDVLLLVAIGISVLVGVFASQLAGETWDTVLSEIKEEEEVKGKDGIVRKFFGIEVPDWVILWQLQFRAADERVREMVDVELDARVWNGTEAIPRIRDPAKAPESPEVLGFLKDVDLGETILDGILATPILFDYYLKLIYPFYDDQKALAERPLFRNRYRDMLKMQEGDDDLSLQGELLEVIGCFKNETRRLLERLE